MKNSLNKPWFESWFDSNYYHLLYKERSQEEADKFIDKLLSNITLTHRESVLDVCCGKGRHCFSFSSFFQHVVGFDLSPRSIEFAKESLRLHTHESRINFFVQDARYFELNQQFDFITNLFTSFGYFDEITDNIKLLQSVRKHLKPEGLFLLDFLNPEVVSYVHGEKNIDGVEFTWHKSKQNGFIVKDIIVLDGTKRFDYQEKVQDLKTNDFQRMFDEVGLKLVKVFGDYDCNQFSAQTSPRQIYLLKPE
ncbi:MAG: class I SAM-dependent methyltransferase [Chitinophagales bacterium]|jgi:SAM-dependent methyltransferase|nr:class I SAM-dependent methyltransferase [Chitinophagales bacterium]